MALADEVRDPRPCRADFIPRERAGRSQHGALQMPVGAWRRRRAVLLLINPTRARLPRSVGKLAPLRAEAARWAVRRPRPGRVISYARSGPVLPATHPPTPSGAAAGWRTRQSSSCARATFRGARLCQAGLGGRTYFFRHPDHSAGWRRVFARVLESRRRVDPCWSAGWPHGEEAYSVACLLDLLPSPHGDRRVVGHRLLERNLLRRKASTGPGLAAVRTGPPDLQGRRKRPLCASTHGPRVPVRGAQPADEPPGRFDLIFCRTSWVLLPEGCARLDTLRARLRRRGSSVDGHLRTPSAGPRGTASCQSTARGAGRRRGPPRRMPADPLPPSPRALFPEPVGCTCPLVHIERGEKKGSRSLRSGGSSRHVPGISSAPPACHGRDAATSLMPRCSSAPTAAVTSCSGPDLAGLLPDSRDLPPSGAEAAKGPATRPGESLRS